MPRSKQLTVATEKHSLRLVQQVPAGTPGAFGPDAIMGAYWKTSRRGLNGPGGFIQVDNQPTLNDMSQFTALLPPRGSDGVDAGDRFYILGVAEPGGGEYFPGDEWLEVRRGYNEIVAVGTPIDCHVDGDQGQVAPVCADVLELLKKTRETAGGFWVHSPRDAFEHYTRLWLPVMAEDFANSATEFPGTASSSLSSSPDGRWQLRETYASGASHIQMTAVNGLATNPLLLSLFTWPHGGPDGHDCWRAEINISGFGAFWQWLDFFVQGTGGQAVAKIRIGPSGLGPSAPVTVSPGGVSAGVAVLPNGAATLAIEARDRWFLYYVNGQLIGCGERSASGGYTGDVKVGVQMQASAVLSSVRIDAIVVRRTSSPLNGGDPGDYQLPSVPTAGGLNGEYFDLATGTFPPQMLGCPIFQTSASSQQQPRLDSSLAFGAANPPAWQPAFVGGFGVRWTGAIYLPLGSQDVTFSLPAGYAGNADRMIVWVGRTRAGEHVLANWPGKSVLATSPSMRSLLSSVSGWYPIVIEYYWQPTNSTPPWTGNADPGFTYSLGGGGSVVPDKSVLAPLGIFHQQVRNDSHYDTLKSLQQNFVYQFRSTPAALESGSFPGTVVPRVRVGRDTDKVLTSGEAVNPALDVNAEDVAAALLGDASGLGGAGTGALSLEAFNYEALMRHPIVVSELENLPQHTFAPQLITNLLSLLGYRSAPWESVQTQQQGMRQMQDSFPLTGALAEFDWQPGDGLRLQLESLFLDDQVPRQILAPQRTLYPDGMGDCQASFRPRIRSPQETLRRFIRMVYGARRGFQGQIVESSGTRAVSPAYSEAILPADISLVKQATLVVLSKSDATTIYDVLVNGVQQFAVTMPGPYDLGPYVAHNASPVNGGQEPRMIVQLVPRAGGGQVAYIVQLRVLIPSL